MKIRPIDSPELEKKAAAVLHRAFPNSSDDEVRVEKLRKRDALVGEWVALHRNLVIGYIGFSEALCDGKKCGLHITALAVHPEFQNEGVGRDLIAFAFRQKAIKEQSIFTLGAPDYFERFGFSQPEKLRCAIRKNNKSFRARNYNSNASGQVGYDPEYK